MRRHSCGLDPLRDYANLPRMDPITLGFYAIVCGALSAVSPVVPGFVIRLGIGAVVGLVAASLLPVLKGMMVGY